MRFADLRTGIVAKPPGSTFFQVQFFTVTNENVAELWVICFKVFRSYF